MCESHSEIYHYHIIEISPDTTLSVTPPRKKLILKTKDNAHQEPGIDGLFFRFSTVILRNLTDSAYDFQHCRTN